MTYLWLKAFHVGAVAAWVGGMLVSAITVAALIGAGRRHPRTAPICFGRSGDGTDTSPRRRCCSSGDSG